MAPKLPPFPKVIYWLLTIDAIRMAGVYCRLAVLAMFLRDFVQLSDRVNRQVFHSQHLVGRLISPLFGVLADNYVGAFWQFFVTQWGLLLVPTSFFILSIRPWVEHIIERLHFIVIGTLIFNSLTGYASLPCFVPFAADQFPSDAQKDEILSRFFSYNYWFVNIGTMVGIVVGPILRQQVKCFGQAFCFTAPFAAYWIGILTTNVLFTMLFLTGQLVRNPPNKKNKFFKIIAMMLYAVRKRCKATEKREHWMDYADDKYEKDLIADAKELRVLYMLVPCVFYYSGYYLTQTTWIFQAARMNGEITKDVEIPPDLSKVVHPVGIIILIPILDYLIFPGLAKKNIFTKLHQKMIVGLVFATAAYVYSCTLFFRLERKDFVKPNSDQLFFYVYNPHDCTLQLKAAFLDENPTIESYESFTIDIAEENTELKISGSCGNMTIPEAVINEVEGGKCIGIYFKANGELVQFDGDLSKNYEGHPLLFHVSDINNTCSYRVPGQSDILSENQINCDDPKKLIMIKGRYDFAVGEKVLIEDTKLYTGAVYAVLVMEKAPGEYEAEILEVTERNTLHMVWILPQLLLFCIADTIFSVAVNEFAYKQAPKSMKMLIQGVQQMISFFSEMVILIVSIFEFPKNSHTTLVYVGLMTFGVLLLIILSLQYKYREDAPTAEGGG